MQKPRQFSEVAHGPHTSGRIGSPPELELLLLEPPLAEPPVVVGSLEDDAACPVEPVDTALELTSPPALPSAAALVEPMSSAGTHCPAVLGWPSSPYRRLVSQAASGKLHEPDGSQRPPATSVHSWSCEHTK